MCLVFLIFVIYLILAQCFLLGLGTWLLTTMFLLRKLRTRLLGFRDSKVRDLSRTFFGYPNPYKMADSNYRILWTFVNGLFFGGRRRLTRKCKSYEKCYHFHFLTKYVQIVQTTFIKPIKSDKKYDFTMKHFLKKHLNLKFPFKLQENFMVFKSVFIR